MTEQESAATNESASMPVRLVRGDATAEELAALLAILATASGVGGADPTDRHTRQWNSPRRMVRTTHPHGPGSWRASALPR